MWREQVSGLSDIRRVIAPDLDGHGVQPTGEPKRSIDEIARILAHRLDSERVNSVDLVGFSMGGYAALAFCRLFADRVNSLALVDSRTAADSDAGRAGRDQMIADIESRGSIAATEAMLPKMFTDEVAPELRDEVGGWMRQQPPEALVADLLAMRDRPDSALTVARLTTPVLVVAGLGDSIIPIAEAEAIAESAVYGRLVVIDGAAHLSPMEQPKLVNDALRQHLGADAGAAGNTPR
jgi:pimeloyl-ACP methyl ester carboxylesterase